MKILEQLIANATLELLMSRDERETEYWRKQVFELLALKKEKESCVAA